MLLGFGGKNIFSFKDGFEVSFELNNNCPHEISEGKNYTNLLAVIGANGSGKTNVLNCLTFINYFVTSSFSLKPEEGIPLRFFKGADENTELFTDFLLDDKRYRYEIELNKDEVIEEILYIDGKIAFKRKKQSIEVKNKTFNELTTVKLRSNVSTISMANQYEIESIFGIYDFFRNSASNVGFDGYRNVFINHNGASKIYYESKEYFKFIKDILKKIDLGISDIEIVKDDINENNEVIYYPMFELEMNGKKQRLTYSEQSNGTKTLYTQLSLYKSVLDSGGVLILDEFDSNLHPDLLPILIELFSSKLNKNSAQFIFTTHHVEILDELKKYKVIVVNKENNESYLYRLDEIKNSLVRNDRSLKKVYDKHILGGKPDLKAYYEEVWKF